MDQRSQYFYVFVKKLFSKTHENTCDLQTLLITSSCDQAFNIEISCSFHFSSSYIQTLFSMKTPTFIITHACTNMNTHKHAYFCIITQHIHSKILHLLPHHLLSNFASFTQGQLLVVLSTLHCLFLSVFPYNMLSFIIFLNDLFNLFHLCF